MLSASLAHLTALTPAPQAPSSPDLPPPTLLPAGTSSSAQTLAVLLPSVAHPSPWTNHCHHPPAPVVLLSRSRTTRTLLPAKLRAPSPACQTTSLKASLCTRTS